ncbi:Flp family type IVb pilin [Brevibacillus dissolubilis]|uniref:Flp family type IVb pilin n=1 Tax=Brevibacillus dissolubilis TaxID=1844116 RepID=UPI001116DED6|nr:Flp family type IVb pilin [Brevibacillus dissolubilis]
MNFINKIKGLWSDNSGQGLVEYALILVLISCAVVGILYAMGIEIGEIFEAILAALEGTPTT